MNRISPFLYSRRSPIFPIGIFLINLEVYNIFVALFSGNLNHSELLEIFKSLDVSSDLWGGMFAIVFFLILALFSIFVDFLITGKKKRKVMEAYISLKKGADFSEISEKLNNLESVISSNCVNYSKLYGGGYREEWVL